MGQLDGQVAFITGGARGMGRSHAVTFAREGADVVLLDMCQSVDTVAYPLATPDDLAETVGLVEKQGRRCLARQGDVRDFAQVEDVVREAKLELGRIDVLVANAGVSAGAPIQVASPLEWQNVIATNLTGVFNSFRAVAPVMVEAGYGRIVGISSMMGRGTTGGMGAYTASKWGVVGLVKSSAQDLAAYGITVNAVAPGNIDTPMIRNDWLARTVRPDLADPTFEDAAKFLGLLHVQPIAVLPPEEVSAAILFLVGPGSGHITGAVLDVSAGASARVTA
jgi:SDR family mycofactocin-dependent oxidoreductase